MYQSSQSQNMDGLQGTLPSKTPVSLLQELCMRRGISPKYDLLQIEGPVHEPTFVYRVTVGEFAANGSGQTKKKAKHAAAKAVLDIIIQGGGGGQAGQPGGGSDLASQIVSPYDDGIPGNPVGSLQERCTSMRWPPPTYDLTAEEGFPHERTFSICCIIGNHREVGTGKSKKLAKRQAAHKMIQKLKDHPVEPPSMNVLADDDDENTTLNSLMLEFVQMLQDISQEATFSVTYVEIEEKSLSGQCQCLVQLSTAPVAVCYGSGITMKDAQAQAAHNALEYLKIMTKA